MGILEYLWPFERKFSEIPCAREAAIAGMVGGIGLGASTIIVFNHPRYAFKTSTYSGFVIFWVTFIVCGVQHRRLKNISDQFVESYKAGELD